MLGFGWWCIVLSLFLFPLLTTNNELNMSEWINDWRWLHSNCRNISVLTSYCWPSDYLQLREPIKHSRPCSHQYGQSRLIFCKYFNFLKCSSFDILCSLCVQLRVWSPIYLCSVWWSLKWVGWRASGAFPSSSTSTGTPGLSSVGDERIILCMTIRSFPWVQTIFLWPVYGQAWPRRLIRLPRSADDNWTNNQNHMRTFTIANWIAPNGSKLYRPQQIWRTVSQEKLGIIVLSRSYRSLLVVYTWNLISHLV